MQLRRRDPVLARHIRNRHPVAEGLQDHRRLHMLRPAPPTGRTRHNLDTPGISLLVPVRSYVCLYVRIHRRLRCYRRHLGQRCRSGNEGGGRSLTGQVSDYTGAAALLSSLPAAEWLLADRGYDADWFREALKDKGIKPCIPGRKSRGKPIKHDKRRYKRRNRIEIMFGRLKDWRRVATRYDRCPKVFLSAVALAATVMFWL
uniref:Transposase, IS4 family n=1 Tax=Cereibacter sphaeroides (strain ATCC 17025 / ATH 2.4.3) TaxID=349102 RepID=A4WNW4_CERS5